MRHPKLFLALVASTTSLLAVQTALAQDNPIDNLTTVTADTLLNPPDGDWLMWRRTYDGWGYSPLDQINQDNVANLQLTWSWGMTPGGTQQTPLVHDGIMFLQNSDHTIQALDARNGNLLWEFEHELPEGVNPAGERSMAIWGDTLIVATRDDHVIAINFRTGEAVWDTVVADYTLRYSNSSGPIIANGVVVQGTTGCGQAQPGGCFFTGLDAATGEIMWRVNTIAQGDDPNTNTWNGVPVASRFGGSAWIPGSYDPVQNLIFAGTGQPYPWNAEIAGLMPPNPDPAFSHEALYTDSTLAIDPNTGELKWYHQYLSTDTLDLDYVYERLLIDLEVNGVMRQTVVTTGKLGIIEALDRVTGEWLWARETVPQNVVLSIDEVTGEKTINPEVIPVIGQTTFNCPADPGGRSWQATAYSPRTGNLYLPTVEFCSNTTVQPLDPGQVYTGGGRQTYSRVPVPNSDGNIGQVRAINLTDLTETWQYRQRSPVTTSALPTGGGLVFVGTLDRTLLAFNDETGELLWTSPRLINTLESFPITYEVDGRQYVAVGASFGNGLGRLISLTPEVRRPASNPVAMFVFALPE
jgi:alcohol dehydrogenase (cytochrome c)